MSQQEVNVVGAQTAQRLIHAGQYTMRRKIELVRSVTSTLGGKNDSVSPSFECGPETMFGQKLPVIRRYIEEVDSLVDGQMNSAFCFFRTGMSINAAERSSAKRHHRDFEVRFAQRTILHLTGAL